MSLAGTFLIISILYMSMSYYFYLWAKKYNKIGQVMKLWPLGFFFICCSAYFLSFISYPQFHFRQILSISLVFLWSLIVFIQINKRLKRKQKIQREQEKELGSILRMNVFQLVVAAPILQPEPTSEICVHTSSRTYRGLAFAIALGGVENVLRKSEELVWSAQVRDCASL